MSIQIAKQPYNFTTHYIISNSISKKEEQDGDLQSQALIRLSKDELRTDILSRDDRGLMIDDRRQLTYDR